MSFEIIKDSITKLNVDCIVNAANESLQAGGGVCGAIFREAGLKELQAECDKIGHCDTGQAVITKAYNLKCKNIIHTPGPIWQGGNMNEKELLYSCYKNSLLLAKKNNLNSIAFPLISAGIFRVPLKICWTECIMASMDFLKENHMEIIIAVLDDNILNIVTNFRGYENETNKDYCASIASVVSTYRQYAEGEFWHDSKDSPMHAGEHDAFIQDAKKDIQDMVQVYFELSDEQAMSIWDMGEEELNALLYSKCQDLYPEGGSDE